MNPKRSKLKSVAMANLLLFFCITLGVGYVQNVSAQTADDEVVEEISNDSEAVQEAVLEAYGLEEAKEEAAEEVKDAVVEVEKAAEVATEEVVAEEVEAVAEEPAVEVVAEVKAELTPLEKSEVARRKAHKASGMAAVQRAEAASVKGDYENAVKEYQLARVELEKVSKLDDEVQATLKKVAAARADIYEEWASKLAKDARKDFAVAKYDDAVSKLTQAKQFNPFKSEEYQESIDAILEKRQAAQYVTNIKAITVDPEKEKRDLDEKTLIEQGKLHLRNGRLDEAKKTFRRALRINPYNMAARNYLGMVEDGIKEVGDKARGVTVKERMNEVTWAWVPALPKVDEAVSAAPTEPIVKDAADEEYLKMQDKLQTIIIKKLDLNEATINEVVTLLIEKSRLYDEKYKEGVNIFLDLGTKAPSVSNDEGEFEDDEEFEDEEFEDEEAEGDFEDEGDDFEDEDAGVGAEVGTGTITFSFKNMPLGEVLKYVCNTAGLKWRAEKHAIVIAKELPIDAEVTTRFFSVRPSFVQALMAGAGSGAGGTDNEYEDYGEEEEGAAVVSASSEELKKGFKALGVSFDFKGTEVSYNQHISKLIVTHTAESLNKIQALINELDTGRPLVNITAKFVEVGQTDMNELGFEWMITDTRSFGSGNGSMDIEATPADPVDITSGLGNLADLLSPDQLGSTAGNIFSSFLTIGNTEFKNTIRALDKKQNVDVLSSPEVTTLSGEEAIIKSVTSRYFPESWTEPEAGSGSGGGTITLDDGTQTAVTNSTPSIPEFGESTELGVVLTVTPTVTVGSKEIELVLNPKVTSFIGYDEAIQIPFPGAPGGFYSPKMAIVEERSLQTRVICDDGETVVLGGLIKEKVTSYSDRVPLLSSIPLIGKLFKAEGEHADKANLLVFVTARLVDSAGRPVREKGRKERTGKRGLPTFDF